MAMSGFTKFVSLVVLIECMNAEVSYPVPFVIKAVGKVTRLQCKVDQSTLQSTALHWYRAKPGGAFQRIMYFDAGGSTAKPDEGFRSGFTGVNRAQQLTLTITRPTTDDTGTYYCAYYSGDKKVFGAGTRLYVTDPGNDKPRPPTVSVYPPSPAIHGKSTMLCQARDMFPDIVTFKWQMKAKAGDSNWASAPEEKGGLLEQRNGKTGARNAIVTSMMIVDEKPANENYYQCTVTHEGTTEPITLDLIKEESRKPKGDQEQKRPTCPPISTDNPVKQPTKTDSSEQTSSLYPFVYAYGVMLIKNALYFCVVFIFLLKRRAGKKDESKK